MGHVRICICTTSLRADHRHLLVQQLLLLLLLVVRVGLIWRHDCSLIEILDVLVDIEVGYNGYGLGGVYVSTVAPAGYPRRGNCFRISGRTWISTQSLLWLRWLWKSLVYLSRIYETSTDLCESSAVVLAIACCNWQLLVVLEMHDWVNELWSVRTCLIWMIKSASSGG